MYMYMVQLAQVANNVYTQYTLICHFNILIFSWEYCTESTISLVKNPAKRMPYFAKTVGSSVILVLLLSSKHRVIVATAQAYCMCVYVLICSGTAVLQVMK